LLMQEACLLLQVGSPQQKQILHLAVAELKGVLHEIKLWDGLSNTVRHCGGGISWCVE